MLFRDVETAYETAGSNWLGTVVEQLGREKVGIIKRNPMQAEFQVKTVGSPFHFLSSVSLVL